MDISLLKSMFADNVGTRPTSLKSVASPHTKQPTEIPADNVPSTNTGTSYNSQVIAQNESTTDSSKDFSNALDKKRKKQDRGSETPSEVVHPAKSPANQELLAQPAVSESAAGKKVLNQLQQQLVVPDNTTGTKVLNQFQQQTESQIPGTSGLLVAGSTLPNSPQTPPLIDQGQIKSEIISPGISNELAISNTQFGKDKNTGKMQVSEEAFVGEEKLVNPENGKELLQKVSPSDNKNLIVTDKTAIISTILSNQQSGKESDPKTLIGNDKIMASSEQSVVTNKASGPDSSKTQLENIQFAALNEQLSNSRQKVLINQGNPAPAAEQTTPNKADTEQQGRHGKIEFFESAEKNRGQVESSSVNPIAQKMTPQQAQLSDAHAEIRSNLVSNQASSSDKNLGEQLLVNNVQPAITEQAPAFASFTKAAVNANSDTSVGSQIQESIQSSFHSGSQEIVIRLNPPEMGKVVVKFTEQGEGIIGLLRVDRPQTRDQLQRALPEMLQNLQNLGIGIKRLEVVLTNHQDQYALKDQSSTAGQNGWSGHQSSPNPESQGNNTTYSKWLTNVNNFMEFTESQMHFGNNSINMLV